MNNPFDTPEMRKLRTEWDEKLKKSGFVDAEDRSHKDCPLKTWHSFKWRSIHKDKREAINTYFEKAAKILTTYCFENPTHKRIWELHCEGYSKRKIEAEIKSLTPTYKREQIGNIIAFIVSTKI